MDGPNIFLDVAFRKYRLVREKYRSKIDGVAGSIVVCP
jgi:hypothetical protein